MHVWCHMTNVRIYGRAEERPAAADWTRRLFYQLKSAGGERFDFRPMEARHGIRQDDQRTEVEHEGPSLVGVGGVDVTSWARGLGDR
jgi:hypothetical protein